MKRVLTLVGIAVLGAALCACGDEFAPEADAPALQARSGTQRISGVTVQLETHPLDRRSAKGWRGVEVAIDDPHGPGRIYVEDASKAHPGESGWYGITTIVDVPLEEQPTTQLSWPVPLTDVVGITADGRVVVPASQDGRTDIGIPSGCCSGSAHVRFDEPVTTITYDGRVTWRVS